MFLVYYQVGQWGGFLYGEGDTLQCYGGTTRLKDAARFATKSQARAMGEAYFKMSGGHTERGDHITLLKEVKR